MLNILFFFIQLLILFFFFKIYFYFLIEYFNLFFIPEIKNFLFQKFNLKVNYAMEINNIKQNPQQFDFNDIENKEYNKKDKILITVGWAVVFICIYIFFKNTMPVEVSKVIEITTEQTPQILENISTIDFKNSDLQIIFDNIWKDEKFRNQVLKPNININLIYFEFKQEFAYKLFKTTDKDMSESIELSKKLLEIYKNEIDNFISLKRSKL